MRNIIISIFIVTFVSCSGGKQPELQVISYKKEAPDAKKDIGVAFRNISLDEALEIAKREKKLVFIDCSTTTCAPCRMMRRTVLSKKECGDFINPQFVPLHINMNEGDGIEIGEKYRIGIYPTYLILNTDGSKRGEVIGAEKNIPKFIKKIRNCANI